MEFSVQKPVFQIFHLIVWAQHYIKLHNCLRFGEEVPVTEQAYLSKQLQPLLQSSLLRGPAPRRQLKKVPWWKGKLKRLFFNDSSLSIKNFSTMKWPNGNSHEFDICQPSSPGIQHSLYALTPINVTAVTWFKEATNAPQEARRVYYRSLQHPLIHSVPIEYVYYSEADQIVRFASDTILDATLAASNKTTYFIGRRREKSRDSDPVNYMGGLNKGRKCGLDKEKYVLEWPKSPFVYKVAS